MPHSDVDWTTQIYRLLADVILPNLKAIQASQEEQRMQTERLNGNLDRFHVEMEIRFAELRAELAAFRNEVEDSMVVLRETLLADARGEQAEAAGSLSLWAAPDFRICVVAVPALSPCLRFLRVRMDLAQAGLQ